MMPIAHLFAPDKGQSLEQLIAQKIQWYIDRYGIPPAIIYVPADTEVQSTIPLQETNNLHRQQIGLPPPTEPRPVNSTIVQKEMEL